MKLSGAFSRGVRGETPRKKFAGVWVCLAMGATVCVAEEDIAPEPSAGEREGAPLASKEPSAREREGVPRMKEQREGVPREEERAARGCPSQAKKRESLA